MISLVARAMDWLGRCISWFVIAMAIITFIVVVMRYVFRIGTIELQELVLYMHGMFFMFGLSYALKHDAHVRVDLIYSRLSPRRRVQVDLFGHLFLLIPVCIVLVMQSIDYVAASWRVLEGSAEVRGLPWVYLLKTVIPVAFVLLLVQNATQVIGCFKELRKQ